MTSNPLPFHHRIRSASRIAALALAAGLIAFGGVTARAEGPAVAEPAAQARVGAEMSEALADLEKLDSALGSRKSINDEIVQYLELVGNHFIAIKGPEMPADATDEAAMKAYQSELAKFNKQVDDYRRKAESAIFKAFKLTLIRNESNERNEVNMKAADVIGRLAEAFPGSPAKVKEDPVAKENVAARESIAARLRGEIDGLHKAKYTLSTDVLQAAFRALGSLNTVQSVEWMIKEYSHAKNNETDWLVAAHKSLVKFTDMPGRVRHALVDQFIRTYAGVESSAEQSTTDKNAQAKKKFWDDIRTFTVPAVQHFAGHPVNAESNEALATMGEFEDWFRDHKNPRKAPWVDE